MRRILALLTLCAAAWSFSCDTTSDVLPATTPTPQPPGEIVVQPGDPLIVGVSVALTGDQSALGADLVDAARIAASLFGEGIEGHPIEIVPRDDGCADPLKAVDVAAAFADEPALVGVIGPMCTSGALAANLRYERAGIIHISPSVTRTDLSLLGDSFFFRTVWRDDAQANVQAAYARQGMGASTAVVISDREPYGNALAEQFRIQFERAGGRILEELVIERGTVDMSGIAGQVVQAEPGVVVYEGVNPDAALLVIALSDAGYMGGFIGPDALLNARDFLIPAGDAARGVVITGGATPSGDYIRAFEALSGRPLSTSFVLQTHDAVTALLRAVDSAGTLDANGTLRIGREHLASMLRSQRFAGLTGSITFDEHGDRRGETALELGISVYRVDAGAFVAID